MMFESIRKKITSLKDSPEELSDYLIDLAKLGDDYVNSNITVFEDSLFNNSSPDLRMAGLYGILFKLKRRDQRYIKQVISLLENQKEDEEVKKWCVTGLSSAFWASKDSCILKLLNTKMLDEWEDFSIRKNCFIAQLNIIGIDTGQIQLRCKVPLQSNNKSFFNINLPIFKDEISEIDYLIEGCNQSDFLSN